MKKGKVNENKNLLSNSKKVFDVKNYFCLVVEKEAVDISQQISRDVTQHDVINFDSQQENSAIQLLICYIIILKPGNNKRGSITVPLTSCLESAVGLLRIFVVICITD
jgi:hypothetical protein